MGFVFAVDVTRITATQEKQHFPTTIFENDEPVFVSLRADEQHAGKQYSFSSHDLFTFTGMCCYVGETKVVNNQEISD